MIDYAYEIKSRVTMPQAMEEYHCIGRHNRVECPFHNGKDKNLSYTATMFKCFVCGEGGDIITFVRKLFDLDFMKAVAKINEDFRLNIPLGEVDEAEKRRLNSERFKRELEKKRKREAFEKIDKEYVSALDEVIRLEKQWRLYKPTNPDEEINPLFEESLVWLDFAYYCLERAEAERNANEHSRY